jgi:alpha-L-fucosidase
MSANKEARMAWFRAAKYGMFIHWGIYAIPAGRWQGKEIEGVGEWIMRKAEIPVREYEQLATRFNPVAFDATEWVQIAKDAGMKYMTISAKHHDGFAMYHSPSSTYNIVDATPFKRDPLKELADACAQEGIIFCIYYSQLQDWHHPHAEGNAWDYPSNGSKNFATYMEEKVKPQLRELLKNYGPIGLMWFDTPYEMPKAFCEEIVSFVHAIQPNCIINGRIGYRLGDYRQMGDNMIPIQAYPDDWETPMTLNNTWGYKEYDHHWKSPAVVLRMLVDVVGKGGNFVLNVGPDASGIIPEPSVEILKTVGHWLHTYGDAIYETTAAPDFPYRADWGGFTAKPGKLFLHIFHWPREAGEIVLYGLKTKVLKAYFLADPAQSSVRFQQRYEIGRDEHRLIVYLPEQPLDPYDTVLALELDGDAEVYFW